MRKRTIQPSDFLPEDMSLLDSQWTPPEIFFGKISEDQEQWWEAEAEFLQEELKGRLKMSSSIGDAK